MKNVKKLSTLILALIMLLTAVPSFSFAEETAAYVPAYDRETPVVLLHGIGQNDTYVVDDEGNVNAVGGGKAEITVLYPEVGLSETIQVVVPGEPDEPDEPVEPDEPDEPDKPCKPEKPSWTDWLKNFFTNFGVKSLNMPSIS